jgi:hypothetical protein
LGGTRTLRSSPPSPGWDRSSAPGCSQNPATTPAGTPSARARKNYAGTSPITRASGKKKTVMARYIHNDRLIDALMTQAFAALTGSPGARAYYDYQRARGAEHNPALRQLANRLVGIQHGCLKTRTLYDEATAWPNHAAKPEKAAA